MDIIAHYFFTDGVLNEEKIIAFTLRSVSHRFSPLDHTATIQENIQQQKIKIKIEKLFKKNQLKYRFIKDHLVTHSPTLLSTPGDIRQLRPSARSQQSGWSSWAKLSNHTLNTWTPNSCPLKKNLPDWHNGHFETTPVTLYYSKNANRNITQRKEKKKSSKLSVTTQ